MESRLDRRRRAGARRRRPFRRARRRPRPHRLRARRLREGQDQRRRRRGVAAAAEAPAPEQDLPATAAPPAAERPIAVAGRAPRQRASRPPRPRRGGTGPRRSRAKPRAAMLRVRADIIDRLVNEAGEVAITRARVEGELRSLKGNLLELTEQRHPPARAGARDRNPGASRRSSRGCRMVSEAAEGFDPLEFDRYTRFQELTRSLAEGVNDVSTVQQSLLQEPRRRRCRAARAGAAVARRAAAAVLDPHGAVRQPVGAPVPDPARRRRRSSTSARTSKSAAAQVELDRSVLEKLVGPLEHLLRNALDHGIEPRATRVAAPASPRPARSR